MLACDIPAEAGHALIALMLAGATAALLMLVKRIGPRDPPTD